MDGVRDEKKGRCSFLLYMAVKRNGRHILSNWHKLRQLCKGNAWRMGDWVAAGPPTLASSPTLCCGEVLRNFLLVWQADWPAVSGQSYFILFFDIGLIQSSLNQSKSKTEHQQYVITINHERRQSLTAWSDSLRGNMGYRKRKRKERWWSLEKAHLLGLYQTPEEKIQQRWHQETVFGDH